MRREALPPRLHVVTDVATAALPDLPRRAAAVARAGRLAIHARAPGWSGMALWRLAHTLRRAGAPLVFVNDRVDVARLLAADGVHLPEAGLPVAAVRALVGENVLVGRSVHSAEQARAATEAGADYVFLGPIFPTASHPDATPLGLEVLEQARPARVVAIGGVTLGRAPQCRNAGAYGVAVLSAIWQAADPGGAAAEMLLSLGDS